MNQTTKDKWIAELRNPERKQAIGVLTTIVNEQKYQCCLGVLCDVMEMLQKASNVLRVDKVFDEYHVPIEVNGQPQEYFESDAALINDSFIGSPPNAFMEKHNLHVLELIHKNDVLMLTFPQIADFLEQELQVTG